MPTYYGGSGPEWFTGTTGNDVFYGGGGNDTLDGREGDDTFYGGAGNDNIFVSHGKDVAYGGDGNDSIDSGSTSTGNKTLSGDAGKDYVLGGAGADLIYGGTGDDVLSGNQIYHSGNPAALTSGDKGDTLFGGDGNDYLAGLLGNDTLHGDLGNDTLYGGHDNDLLYGGDNDDVLYGESNGGVYFNAGSDTLYGGNGNDKLYGEAGNDTLHGDAGNDTLYGGDGKDFINGDQGVDTAYGGLGSDTFAGTFQGGDIVVGGEDPDNSDIDILDLTALGVRNVDYSILYAAGNHEAGVVTILTGPNAGQTFNFSEIENVVCFTAGTLIATKEGEVAIESLGQGDLVLTRDHGFQPVRWIGKARLGAADLFARPHLRPIRIKAGALGRGLPTTDLVVSPQHRVLVISTVAHRMFGQREVLVAAKHLTELNGVEVANDLRAVDY